MIAVVGLGFVGLTTALGFSEKGFKVYGYDSDAARASQLKAGSIPFHEPGLQEALARQLGNNFILSNNISDAVRNSEILFLCVGTPSKENGVVDLTYINKAIADILESVGRDFKVLVIKSTVPPATTTELISPFIEKRGFTVGKDLGVANNPEFLREGFAWDDFMNPDRIVVGVADRRSADLLRKIYAPFTAPFHEVSLNTGEFVKYLSNTLLATLISYANEMSMVAETIGDIDIPGSFKILYEDKRWSGQPSKMTSYVYPGCGFGGYCLPKDTQAVYMQSCAKGFEPRVLKEVVATNGRIRSFLVEKVSRLIKTEKKIGILGLSFKPGSDDVRETPAKYIIEGLLEKGYCNIIAYDPMAVEAFKNSYPYPINYAATLEELVNMADYLLLVTAWDEFKLNELLLRTKPLLDFRYYL